MTLPPLPRIVTAASPLHMPQLPIEQAHMIQCIRVAIEHADLGFARLRSTLWEAGSLVGIESDAASDRIHDIATTAIADVWSFTEATARALDVFEGLPHVTRRSDDIPVEVSRIVKRKPALQALRNATQHIHSRGLAVEKRGLPAFGRLAWCAWFASGGRSCALVLAPVNGKDFHGVMVDPHAMKPGPAITDVVFHHFDDVKKRDVTLDVDETHADLRVIAGQLEASLSSQNIGSHGPSGILARAPIVAPRAGSHGRSPKRAG